MIRDIWLSVIITIIICVVLPLLFFALKEADRLEDCEYKAYRHVPFFNGKFMTTIVQVYCTEEDSE